MDGRNSSGRKISLLNDDSPSVPIRQSSRSSSYSSTPCTSPRTPLLVRSDSTDSAIMASPSPITPDLAYDGLTMSQHITSPAFSDSAAYFTAAAKEHVAYPPVPHVNGPLPYPPSSLSMQQALPQTPPQATFYRASATDRRPIPTQPGNAKSKKNSYPCPLAKQFNCNDYFTTSGHAARHAKKHTGKKDAFCPECNKAFTRKDNMEQHRRTHQNGRNASKAGDDLRAKKAKHMPKRPKPAPLQSRYPPVDPALPVSPSSSFAFASALSSSEVYMPDFAIGRPHYPDPTHFAQQPVLTDNPNRSPSFGLDALAIAADHEKRNFC